jgi:putative intracellular protease/amidase
MCVTTYDAAAEVVTARHVTTGKSVRRAWSAWLGVEDNHVIAATLVLGREPEFQAACEDGGFIFGVDPANDEEGA